MAEKKQQFEVRVVGSLNHSGDWHHVHADNEADALERTKRQAKEDGIEIEIVELVGWNRTNPRRVRPDGSVVQVESAPRELGKVIHQTAMQDGSLGVSFAIGGAAPQPKPQPKPAEDPAAKQREEETLAQAERDARFKEDLAASEVNLAKIRHDLDLFVAGAKAAARR